MSHVQDAVDEQMGLGSFASKAQGAFVAVAALAVVGGVLWWAKGDAKPATTTKGAPLPPQPQV